jgi:hypothetical protein
MRVRIRDDLSCLISYRAKREHKKFEQVVNELLGKALWKEPEVIFKGKAYKVEEDLFETFVPKVNDFEEDP